jgi:hypothetical protein
MRKRLPLVLAAVLSACDVPPTPLEPLHILDVMPLTQKTNESKTVRVQLDADPSFLVDYGAPAARMVGQPRMEIGPRAIPLTYLGHGLFEGYVEPLVAGSYPVGVTLGDGREATFATPYQVTSVARASYEFARVDPQVQGQPFTVTITVSVHGQVTGEPPFEGSATLTVYSGGKIAFRAEVGPFTAGKTEHQVTIDQSGDDFVALIKDAEGEQAYSNAFPVAPPPL